MAEAFAAAIETFSAAVGTEMTLTATEILYAGYTLTTLAAVACVGPAVRVAQPRNDDETRARPGASQQRAH